MDSQTLLNLGLVLLFVLVGGVFAATELALVSLRESQLTRMERESARGVRVAAVARNPNRFLAAVQIGVTVAGFFSAAYGAATLAPDLAPLLERVGIPEGASETTSLVVMTLVVAYLSLVLGELVPKRLALQRSASLALTTAPVLDRFATLMRPVIWLLSVSTDAVVRLLGGDPSATSEEVSEEELRDIVTTHGGLGEQERRMLEDVFAAKTSTVKEVMQPRGNVEFVDGSATLGAAVELVRAGSYSRYPVIEGDFDNVTGFLHVRDLLGVTSDDARRVREVQREILMLPATNQVLGSVTEMRERRAHLAVVVDEYGGTDGIVTLEDLVEEIVGEITDEYDAPDEHHPEQPAGERVVSGGLSIEDFDEATGVALTDGAYETVGGFVMAHLGRIPTAGDAILLDTARLEVERMDGLRVDLVRVVPLTQDAEAGGDTGPAADSSDSGPESSSGAL